MTIHHTIDSFVQKTIELELIEPLDQIYVTNRLLALLKLDEHHDFTDVDTSLELLDYLEQLIDYARNIQIIDDTQSQADILEAAIMDLVIPYPSKVNAEFWRRYEESIEGATEYFYELSKISNYIKTRSLKRNRHFITDSKYGTIEITINLAKPEKDPKEIAKAKEAPVTNYPKSALSMENEGYQGHINHAARQNHRVIRMNLFDKVYGFQYSPYLYYDEHSIFFNSDFVPMAVDERCYRNLLEIVRQLPHYFVGSNADLPIVGGSILSHDHYQGGKYTFPIEKTDAFYDFSLEKFPSIEAKALNWPLSTIRLTSKSAEDLVELALIIHQLWENYSDLDHDILSHTGDVKHNTITPIARNKGDHYELDLVLRNNRTSEEYPDGIFHPHSDVQHIKKENIGLIEVMGLAILPGRLIEEVQDIKEYILGEKGIDSVKSMHQDWAQTLKEDYSNYFQESFDDYIQEAIGKKFERVLEDAGVYKQTEYGRQGFKTFIEQLNEEAKL